MLNWDRPVLSQPNKPIEFVHSARLDTDSSIWHYKGHSCFPNRCDYSYTSPKIITVLGTETQIHIDTYTKHEMSLHHANINIQTRIIWSTYSSNIGMNHILHLYKACHFFSCHTDIHTLTPLENFSNLFEQNSLSICFTFSSIVSITVSMDFARMSFFS